MPKTPPPLVGFNNNVRHHGRIFHIQTEDSGVKRPHVMTHLFADGGRVLKSIKTDYSEHLGRADTQTTVRRLMKEQHKAMFVALRSGELDAVVEAAFGPPPSVPEGLEPPVSEASHEIVSATPEELASRAAPLVTPLPLEWKAAVAVATPSAPPEPAPGLPRVDTPEPAPAERVEQPPAGVFERVPSNLLSAVEAMAAQAAGMPPRPVQETPAPLTAATALQRRRQPESPGRYSVSRPASIFEEAPAPEAARSLFGDPLIGEKSLDEVILSYLAEDLDSPTK